MEVVKTEDTIKIMAELYEEQIKLTYKIHDKIYITYKEHVTWNN